MWRRPRRRQARQLLARTSLALLAPVQRAAASCRRVLPVAASRKSTCFSYWCGRARLPAGSGLPGSSGEGDHVLGSWGNTMRDAVRNKERWRRRRTPTQDPSTSLYLCSVTARVRARARVRVCSALPVSVPCPRVSLPLPLPLRLPLPLPLPAAASAPSRCAGPSSAPSLGGAEVEASTGILGRRTAPPPPLLVSNRVPHGVTPRS